MSAARHLYVHLPFCESRCGYCAFVVHVGELDQRDHYLDALTVELRAADDLLDDTLDTVYLGGGTPTLMGADRVRALIESLGDRVSEATEVSIEANPETVDAEAFRRLHEAGITRVSIGVQSFQPSLLVALERRATADQAYAAVIAAREAGIRSVNVDLLFGVMGQSRADLERDLERVRDLRPDHVSWYELEVKEQTTLSRRGAVVDEDFSEHAYERIVDELEGLGYRWYETANFALDGHRCRHNLAYWGAADFVGVGVGAVSMVDGVRWRNAAGLADYIDASRRGVAPRRSHEELDEDTRRRERWMLALRRDEPVSLDWTGPPDHPDQLHALADAGLLDHRDGRVVLTRRGRFLQNAVLGKLMEYS